MTESLKWRSHFEVRAMESFGLRRTGDSGRVAQSSQLVWSYVVCGVYGSSQLSLDPLRACPTPTLYVFAMSGFKVFSESVQSAAPQLEPTLEAALRKYDVHEDIIMGFRCNRIKSLAVFVALDRTVEGLEKTLKEAFGVDAEQGFTHKREIAQLIAAWEESKVQAETTNKVQAVARAHVEPISHLGKYSEGLQTEVRDKDPRVLPPGSILLRSLRGEGKRKDASDQRPSHK